MNDEGLTYFPVRLERGGPRDWPHGLGEQAGCLCLRFVVLVASHDAKLDCRWLGPRRQGEIRALRRYLEAADADLCLCTQRWIEGLIVFAHPEATVDARYSRVPGVVA
jgi:hypothetical protein